MTANVAERSPSGDTPQNNPERSTAGDSMDGMAPTPAHAKPARKNHLWVLFAIAFPAAVEVWASWVGVGSRSGFPVIRLPFGLPAFSTGFSLAVGMEAYWGYALYVWLAAAPGPRSRAFAMWSAICAFALSLLGQVGYHLMLAEHMAGAPVLIVVFVAALPVTLLGLTAILIHLMHADRRDADEAAEVRAREAAEVEQAAAGADELTAMRDALEAEIAAREAAEADREIARGETAEIAAQAEILERKLAAAVARNARKDKRATPPRGKGANPHATEVPNDVDAQAEALAILAAEPNISGAKLGPRVGKSGRWGQLFLQGLTTASAPKGQDPEEAS
jgi:hypothetical protein